MTPERSGECEAYSLAIVTELLLAKPAQATNELGAAARDASYAVSLHDVAFWAVEAAIERWHRGECGLDLRGEERDYRWAPDTATLRKLAQSEEWAAKYRLNKLRDIASATPEPPEPNEEQRRTMRTRIAELLASLRFSPVPKISAPKNNGKHAQRVAADLAARKARNKPREEKQHELP